MPDATTRAADRRNELLNQLEAAEKEWGARQQKLIEDEAQFFKSVLDNRGVGSSTSRIQDSLENLTVDKINEFFIGTP
jgi:hypothetical protein